MPGIPDSPGTGRYLIHGRVPRTLAAFVAEVQADPAIELLDLIGPSDAPHTAVVRMPHGAARALAERFRTSQELSIEPDQPLSLFSGGSRDANRRKKMAKSTESPSHSPETRHNGSDQTRAERVDDARAAFAPSSEQPAAQDRRHTVSGRKSQFLVAPRISPGMQLMGIQPLQFSMVEQALRNSPDIEIVDTVGPKNELAGLSADLGAEGAGVLVTRMSEQKAAILSQQAQGRLIVERDQPLNLLDVSFQMPPLVSGALPQAGPALEVRVIVLGKDGAPVPEAEVYLFGSLLPAAASTDRNGEARVRLIGESPQALRALYVKPRCDYWSFYQERPDISTDEPNVVGLRPISDWPSLSGFPERQLYGWGQRAMRLDQLPPGFTGRGVRVAVIDSGADNGHHDLSRIRAGFDVINKRTSPDTWNQDLIAHGSHCAGVIAGADSTNGVRGFAPDAEIHVCKLFPGGEVSQLIDALEYCIEKQIDVVNLSLGGAEPSEALEQQLLRARRAGIACIAAAGNSGSRVQYPASSPHVLAVAAIGHVSEFPPDSYHAQTVPQVLDPNGYFVARFSCFGPEIDVCAPGVAIASSVPPNNYAVWDGTSMAAPHITGLAALVLAHHPDFQGPYRMRGAERVDRLFQIIKASARPIHAGDIQRTGAGLPDVLIALGLQPPLRMQPALAAGAALGSGMGALFGLPPGQAAAPMPAIAAPGVGAMDAAAFAFLQQLGRMPGAFGAAPGIRW